MLLVCIRLYLYFTRMLTVCYSYVFVCTRMLLVCYSYVPVCIVCYSYVTRMLLVVLVWSISQDQWSRGVVHKLVAFIMQKKKKLDYISHLIYVSVGLTYVRS